MVKIELWGREVDLDLNKETIDNAGDILKEMDDLLPGSEHGWFDSPASGKVLHYRKYSSSTSSSSAETTSSSPLPKAICIWCHGILGHCSVADRLKNGRILNQALLSSKFVDAGFVQYSLDLLGHGFSEGTRFFLPESDYVTNRNDLDEFARYVASQYPDDTPLFLVGESYGGALSLHVGRQWQDANDNAASSTPPPPPPPPGFRGLVLFAPAVIGDTPPLPITLFLRHVLAPLFPKWVPFFMPNPISADRIWSDLEVRDLRVNHNHLRDIGVDGSSRPFRLGTAVGLLNAVETLRSKKIPGLRAPFCVMHGTLDEGVRIEGTDYLLDKSATAEEDRVFMKIENTFHDLLAEPTAETTVDFAITWMKERLMKGPAFSKK